MRPTRRLERWGLKRLSCGPMVEPSKLDRFTVVILSFRRPELVLLQLMYWSGMASHHLTLHGSPGSIPRRVQEAVDARTELDYIKSTAG